MAGNFGYELDVTEMSMEEKEAVKTQVTTYKGLRKLIQYGDFYRLLSPFEGNHTAWMLVSEDKKEAVVFFYRILNTPNDALYRFKLNGLCMEYNYELEGTEDLVTGSQLMQYGLNVPADLCHGDFKSKMFVLRAR